MCNRKECNGVNTDHDWCGSCGTHMEESSTALHIARNHKPIDPKAPGPVG